MDTYIYIEGIWQTLLSNVTYNKYIKGRGGDSRESIRKS